MMLQTGNSDVNFKPRLVEGANQSSPPEPERLILDGQQRLTSLFQSLFLGQAVTTRDARGNQIKRWYYVDIRKSLDPNADREDAIVSLPEDRNIRNFRGDSLGDYSTIDLECAAELLPLPLLFDVPGLTSWQMRYLQIDPSRMSERLTRWNDLIQAVIQRFQQYQMPLILLRKETPKEAVCQVFEKVNTGGVSLTVFELLTATYATDDFNLRDDWAAREKRFKHYRVLNNVKSDDFLQAITLLATHQRRLQNIKNGGTPENAPGVSCKRKDILKLDIKDYKTWAEPVTRGFERAARFFYAQNIFSARDLPYGTQGTPLAAIFALLGDQGDNAGIKAKLARWYWCGVFGELYGSAIETRFAKDLPEVLASIAGGAEPTTVSDANFAPARLLTLRTRNSAAYKGLSALLMREGGQDFRTGDPIDMQMYFDSRIDIHHIFPQDWCKKKGIDARRCDSIVNKTPISGKTNRMISNNAPSVYLARMQKGAGINDSTLDAILLTHVIEPATLRADNFDTFFTAREAALLHRIETAMGKQIAREMIVPEVYQEMEFLEEDLVEAV